MAGFGHSSVGHSVGEPVNVIFLFLVMPASPILSKLYTYDGVMTLDEIEIPSNKMGDFLSQERKNMTITFISLKFVYLLFFHEKVWLNSV
jgi:hypothetical protein